MPPIQYVQSGRPSGVYQALSRPPRPNDRAGGFGANPPSYGGATRPNDRGGRLGIGAGATAGAVARGQRGAPKGVGALPGDEFTGPDYGSFYPEAPTAGGNPYDYADPILMKIQALNTQAKQDAIAGALATRKQLAIQYGDPAGILEGDQADPNTAQAAHDNPFSILAEINRGYTRGTENLDEELNKQGLYYSGERAKQLGLAAEEKQRQLAQARGTLQGRLGEVSGGLAAALMNADRSDIAGQEAAAGRATARATQYGYDPGEGAAPTDQPGTRARVTPTPENIARIPRHFADPDGTGALAPQATQPISLAAALSVQQRRRLGRGESYAGLNF